jgi:hypothetical protein
MNKSRTFHLGAAVALVIGMFPATSALAVNDRAIEEGKGRVIEHWTPARMQQAIPRDFVIDAKGHGYLRKPDGSLKPYGHQMAAHRLSSDSPTPAEKPTSPGGGNGGGKGGGGGGNDGGGDSSADTTPPTVTNMDPTEGAVIGASHTFSAKVTDTSGIKSVSFIIYYPNGVNNQKFTPSKGADDVWSITINGFSDGDWSWSVVAKDGGPKGGNSGTVGPITFSVDTGSADGSTINNDPWDNGGTVQTAAGRIYFEMPYGSGWSGFVCSGTVVTDETSGRSIILTAAHCVYDDANNVFARNVLFIPNQAQTSGIGTDLQCGNDPLGCWVPSFGAVDIEWTRRTFPNNVKWDYAYYVVNDTGAHQGTSTTTESLESEAGALPVSFLTPLYNDGDPGPHSADYTYALGYSYSDDPNFMYCAEDMTTEGSVNWWLASCELSGGSSGGPWVQPMDTDTGSGPVISVNSWGYTTTSGMAGPMLHNTGAECVFTMAKSTEFIVIPSNEGKQGISVDCP